MRKVVVVGGGSAGWLTANILAARFQTGNSGIAITLLESPNVQQWVWEKAHGRL